MTDLTEFLYARLDEDQQTARAIDNLLGEDSLPVENLAAVDAKRRIIRLHESGDAGCDYCIGWYDGDANDQCPTLQALALPYQDHPDFRDEWSI